MGKSANFNRNLMISAIAACALVFTGLFVASTAEAKYNPRKAIWGPTYDLKTGQTVIPIYKQLGVGIYSIALDWRRIARQRPKNPTDPNDPAYKWVGSVVTTVPLVANAGIRVNIQITHAPAWANGGRPFNWTPINMRDFPRFAKDYSNFAIAAARRFPQVHMWMVWGEPSRRANFMPYESQCTQKSRTCKGKDTFLRPAQAQGPKRYALLVDSTYRALKKLNRKNLIIAGNTYTSGDIRAPMWIRYMKLPNGKPPQMDLYGHNPFSFRKPNIKAPQSLQNALYGIYEFSDVGRLAGLVNKSLARPRGKKTVPLFLSEWCVPTGIDREFNKSGFNQVTELEQAQWINSAMSILNGSSSSFIYALGWIHLRDSSGISTGLMRADGKPKPGFTAFSNG